MFSRREYRPWRPHRCGCAPRSGRPRAFSARHPSARSTARRRQIVHCRKAALLGWPVRPVLGEPASGGRQMIGNDAPAAGQHRRAENDRHRCGATARTLCPINDLSSPTRVARMAFYNADVQGGGDQKATCPARSIVDCPATPNHYGGSGVSRCPIDSIASTKPQIASGRLHKRAIPTQPKSFNPIAARWRVAAATRDFNQKVEDILRTFRAAASASSSRCSGARRRSARCTGLSSLVIDQPRSWWQLAHGL